jgi:pimeloyl-ACP methyl ester carboxylesterase
MQTVRTTTLEIAYEDSGPAEGPPVVLLHGFPDDVRAYDGVTPALAAAGWRVVVPYLRGYGPSRFLDPLAPRSGRGPHSAKISRIFSTRLASNAPRLPAMIGAAEPPASSPPYGRAARRPSRLDRRLQYSEHRPVR